MIVSKVFKWGPSSSLSFTGPDEEAPLESLKIFGKSTQNGTPSVSAPVPISYIASGGTIVLTVTAGGNSRTISIPVSNGLKGIKYIENPYKYLVGNGMYLTTQDGTRLTAKE